MNDHHQIQELEARLRAAMLSGDLATLEDLIDEDMCFTDQNGQVLTRADDLALHRSGLLRLERMDLADRRIRLLGEVAIVTLRTALAGTYDGQPFAGTFAYTRVWQRQPEGWRIAAAHCSAVA